MPIRFRCVYCGQLLGIARRKAGTTVRCTKCQGQIVVPVPEHEAVGGFKGRKSDHQMAGSRLFERSDLEDLLKPIQEDLDRRVADTVKTGHDIEMPLQNPPPTPLPHIDRPAADWLSWGIWIGIGSLVFVVGFFLGRLSVG